MCPAYRSRFFRFDTQNFRNVAASGSRPPYEVHAPLRGPRPPTGNPGSATVMFRKNIKSDVGNGFILPPETIFHNNSHSVESKNILGVNNLQP